MNGEQIPACSICGGLPVIKHDSFPGYQQPDTFQIFHCDHCNTAFALPRQNSDALYEIIYQDANKIPGYDRYHKYSREIRNHNNPLDYLSQAEETYWGVKAALTQLVKDKATTTILEIGSGLGYLTYALNQTNYQVTGLDISQTAVNQAIKNFGDHYICTDLFEYAEMKTVSFDIVILTEVIEHVENPQAFIDAINQLLKPGGHAIITTPNKSFYFKDIIWSTELPPIHFWWFSETSLTQLANHSGMKINFINFTEYYKDKYFALDMKKLRESPPPQPIFNQNGELIAKRNQPNNQASSPLRTLLTKIPFLLDLYHKLKQTLNKDLIVCGPRGTVLCAVLQKPLESSY